MDVYIDTSAISEGVGNLRDSIATLDDCVSFIRARVDSVANDFTSINYDRVRAQIQSAMETLAEMAENLQSAKEYLDKLNGLVEDYHKLKY